MDIKNIVRTVLPFGVNGPQKAKEAAVTTENTHEREGNGQAGGEEQKKRRNLSPEEIEEAIKYLEGLPGVKDNGLTVKLAHTEGVPHILVMDRTGKVVRRIPETEISALTANKEKKSGHLLNKAM